MRIEIVPKSKRAKDRIAQHGRIMELREQEEGKFLVESLEATWSGMKWVGWFTEQEATFRKLDHGNS